MSVIPGREPDLDPYLRGRPDPGFAVRLYDLELDYRVARNRLDARATLTLLPERDLDRIQLRLEGLRVSQVAIAGQRGAKWVQRAGALVIRPRGTLPAGAHVDVEIRYAGNPRPHRGTWGEVGWEELEDGVIVAGQPDGAPSWFPCHDSPADKTPYRIAVTAEAPYTVVCNGVLTARSERSGRSTWVYEQREPMAAYLATVQVGRYERREVADAPVPMTVYAPPRLRGAVAHDLERQPRMMETFQRLFGPYPFTEYSVVVTHDDLEIPLEAQGLATFGANHMDGERGSERLVAHELAHQWFGNALTVGRWRDIWLHEGFACYAEWLWSDASGGPSADALARAAHARLADLPQDLVIGDPGPDLMFDDRLYKRGALTLHALRLTLGDEVFFDGIRAWVAAHRYGTVETEDLLASLEDHAVADVRSLVSAWLDEPGLPPLPPLPPPPPSRP
ncbi:M1 family metallopeptidase [Demequina silvatica]|uniref:M1 family metallopeptidase n=1 Tax=Demequina silvatica TaxID=1638988 RepID=UPI000780B23A|nr:M1 family metallopeptidase [Demequina silvatica]